MEVEQRPPSNYLQPPDPYMGGFEDPYDEPLQDPNYPQHEGYGPAFDQPDSSVYPPTSQEREQILADSKKQKGQKKEKMKKTWSLFSTSSKKLNVKVMLLDDTTEIFLVDKRSTGLALYDEVVSFLQLIERDYFGLYYEDEMKLKVWLDCSKKLKDQNKSPDEVWRFGVKFFAPDPLELTHDLTRYLMCLQIRNDILNEKLRCSELTKAILGSYTAQAELGDWNEEECGSDFQYLLDASLKFSPQTSPELLQKIVELHKQNEGQTPAQADSNFLENARKLGNYGITFFPAIDQENMALELGFSHEGVMVFWNGLKINKFSWPKILKISFKGKNFYIKVKPADFERFEKIIGFKTYDYKMAKQLWKVAIEHHIFWRLEYPDAADQVTGILGFGSKRYRLSSRTFSTARTSGRRAQQPEFERMESKRRSNNSSRYNPHQLPRSVAPHVSPPQNRRVGLDTYNTTTYHAENDGMNGHQQPAYQGNTGFDYQSNGGQQSQSVYTEMDTSGYAPSSNYQASAAKPTPPPRPYGVNSGPRFLPASTSAQTLPADYGVEGDAVDI